jgi:hypothetical protein
MMGGQPSNTARKAFFGRSFCGWAISIIIC